MLLVNAISVLATCFLLMLSVWHLGYLTSRFHKNAYAIILATCVICCHWQLIALLTLAFTTMQRRFKQLAVIGINFCGLPPDRIQLILTHCATTTAATLAPV
jgi:hypothetical protein